MFGETLVEVVATRWKKGGGRHGTIWFDILKWNNIARDSFLIVQKQPAAKESAVTPKAFISDIQSLAAHLSAVGAGNPFIEFPLSFSPVMRVDETQSLCSWQSQSASQRVEEARSASYFRDNQTAHLASSARRECESPFRHCLDVGKLDRATGRGIKNVRTTIWRRFCPQRGLEKTTMET